MLLQWKHARVEWTMDEKCGIICTIQIAQKLPQYGIILFRKFSVSFFLYRYSWEAQNASVEALLANYYWLFWLFRNPIFCQYCMHEKELKSNISIG